VLLAGCNNPAHWDTDCNGRPGHEMLWWHVSAAYQH
jgi:hypothetical protein